ncbi:MAG: alpha/beta hydrolase fold domain-containing protein [Flavobacteriaceae bacterium]|nr:alpha/beta hydrolase fold domain-containing protein [Flavobacteriaceae bacterium]
MTIIKNLSISGQHTKPILTDVYYNKTGTKKPIVIFAHGYKGYKDWGAWNLVAQTFADSGIVFIKFNFSHNGGTAQQPIDFPDLEAFGNNNFIKELDDLQSVIDWVFNNKDLQQEADMSSITLIGHSRGGGIVTIKAQEEPRVSSLITWASVSDFGARFPTGELLEVWRKKGVSYVENGRTKQQMPHYFQFYQNFIDNKDRLNIKKAVQNLDKPHFIIHGQADETVKLLEAQNIHKWNPKSELYIVQEANHTFGAKHPWEDTGLPKPLQKSVAKSIAFILN